MHKEELPEHLIVAAAGEFEAGLAVRLWFEMKEKKSFSIIVFLLDEAVTLTKEDLLWEFDQIRSLFVMDYADPRELFTGKINADAMTEAQIMDAIAAYHHFSKVLQFPPEYLQNLEKALQINPKSDCLVAFEKLN